MLSSACLTSITMEETLMQLNDIDKSFQKELKEQHFEVCSYHFCSSSSWHLRGGGNVGKVVRASMSVQEKRSVMKGWSDQSFGGHQSTMATFNVIYQ